MVLKEDVSAWFQNIESYQRLDLLCGLLHLCSPLEFRFIGAFIEDQARTDFSRLKEYETKANDHSECFEIGKIPEKLLDPSVRRKIVLYLSLIHSDNTICSHTLYGVLTKLYEMLTLRMGSVSEDQNNHCDMAKDVILLFTMAAYHPAFTSCQRLDLYEYWQVAEKAFAKYLNKVTTEFGLYKNILE